MIRELIIVSIGSFFGGGLRFAVSKLMQATCASVFPTGTFTVNIVGCLLIGFFSGLNYPGGWMSDSTKLILTTGLCGGFTTFSTFMNESVGLMKDGCYIHTLLYISLSIFLGLCAVIFGHWIAKSI